MANKNKLNITIACPIDLIGQANQLALAIGLTSEDVDTFGSYITEINGHEYSIANLRARASFVFIPQMDLTEMSIEKGADPVVVTEMQQLLDVWDGEGPPPVADPNKLVVIVQGKSPKAGIKALGMLRGE